MSTPTPSLLTQFLKTFLAMAILFQGSVWAGEPTGPEIRAMTAAERRDVGEKLLFLSVPAARELSRQLGANPNMPEDQQMKVIQYSVFRSRLKPSQVEAMMDRILGEALNELPESTSDPKIRDEENQKLAQRAEEFATELGKAERLKGDHAITFIKLYFQQDALHTRRPSEAQLQASAGMKTARDAFLSKVTGAGK
jgi:hypothetical protein